MRIDYPNWILRDLLLISFSISSKSGKNFKFGFSRVLIIIRYFYTFFFSFIVLYKVSISFSLIWYYPSLSIMTTPARYLNNSFSIWENKLFFEIWLSGLSRYLGSFLSSYSGRLNILRNLHELYTLLSSKSTRAFCRIEYLSFTLIN